MAWKNLFVCAGGHSSPSRARAVPCPASSFIFPHRMEVAWHVTLLCPQCSDTEPGSGHLGAVTALVPGLSGAFGPPLSLSFPFMPCPSPWSCQLSGALPLCLCPTCSAPSLAAAVTHSDRLELMLSSRFVPFVPLEGGLAPSHVPEGPQHCSWQRLGLSCAL